MRIIKNGDTTIIFTGPIARLIIFYGLGLIIYIALLIISGHFGFYYQFYWFSIGVGFTIALRNFLITACGISKKVMKWVTK